MLGPELKKKKSATTVYITRFFTPDECVRVCTHVCVTTVVGMRCVHDSVLSRLLHTVFDSVCVCVHSMPPPPLPGAVLSEVEPADLWACWRGMSRLP